MQVDPIKPKLKAPGSWRLKLQYDEPPSTFAFKFYLRRFTTETTLRAEIATLNAKLPEGEQQDESAAATAAAATESTLRAEVGRCRSTHWNPT